MKNGFLTSEFWTMIAGQVIALLVTTHAISADQAGLTDAINHAIQAIFGLASSLVLARSYIHSRTTVKAAAHSADTVLPAIFAVALVVGFAGFAGAAPPQPTSWSPWRDSVENRLQKAGTPAADPNAVMQTMLLQQIVSQNERIIAAIQGAGVNPHAPGQQPIFISPQAAPQQPPAQPQIIVLGAPRQDIPLGGAPQQQIPLGGPPSQQVPLGGPPYQLFPLGDPPLQQIPLGGPPRQILDGGQSPPAPQARPPRQAPQPPLPIVPPSPTPPKQQIPLGNQPMPMAPPATTSTHATMAAKPRWTKSLLLAPMAQVEMAAHRWTRASALNR